MHSRWAKEGEATFGARARGGRHLQNLTAEQQAALLEPFAPRAQAGGMLTVSEIQQAYRARTARRWRARL